MSLEQCRHLDIYQWVKETLLGIRSISFNSYVIYTKKFKVRSYIIKSLKVHIFFNDDENVFN